MAVRLVPCRHETTGAETDIPETALPHLPAYVPTAPADRQRLGYTDPASDQTPPPADPPDDGGAGAPTSKPATGAAKKTKE